MMTERQYLAIERRDENGIFKHDARPQALPAGCVALVFSWWNLFVRLADPAHHREASSACCSSSPNTAQMFQQILQQLMQGQGGGGTC
jgi:hypothetical protein